MFFRRRWPYSHLTAALAAWDATLTGAPATRRMYRQQVTEVLAKVDLTQLRARDLPRLKGTLRHAGRVAAPATQLARHCAPSSSGRSRSA